MVRGTGLITGRTHWPCRWLAATLRVLPCFAGGWDRTSPLHMPNLSKWSGVQKRRGQPHPHPRRRTKRQAPSHTSARIHIAPARNDAPRPESETSQSRQRTQVQTRHCHTAQEANAAAQTHRQARQQKTSDKRNPITAQTATEPATEISNHSVLQADKPHNSTVNYYKRGSGGGGVWDPKVCVPTMACSDFRCCKFRFFPRWSLWSGRPEGGGGIGTRPWCWFAFLWRRLLASRHCTFRPPGGPNVLWLCQGEGGFLVLVVGGTGPVAPAPLAAGLRLWALCLCATRGRVPVLVVLGVVPAGSRGDRSAVPACVVPALSGVLPHQSLGVSSLGWGPGGAGVLKFVVLTFNF